MEKRLYPAPAPSHSLNKLLYSHLRGGVKRVLGTAARVFVGDESGEAAGEAELPVPLFEPSARLTRSQALADLAEVLDRYHKSLLPPESVAPPPPLDEAAGALLRETPTEADESSKLLPTGAPPVGERPSEPYVPRAPAAQVPRAEEPPHRSLPGSRRTISIAPPDAVLQRDQRSENGSGPTALSDEPPADGAHVRRPANVASESLTDVRAHAPTSRRREVSGYQTEPRQRTGIGSIGKYAILAQSAWEAAELNFVARHADTGELATVVARRVGSELPPSALERLGEWAALMQGSQFPHNAQILEAGVDRGLLYYAAPATGGILLEELLQVHRRFAAENVLRILTDLAEALDHLRARGMSHGDLKPSSIIVASDLGAATLLGGGLADVLRGHSSLASSWAPTPGYHPPELKRFQRVEIDSDQYALAVIAYEMFTSRRHRVFDASLGLFVVEPITIPFSVALAPGIPLSANAALNRVLSAGGRRQFESCADLVRAIRGQFAHGTQPAADAELPRRRFDRLRLVRASAVLLLIGAAILFAASPAARSSAERWLVSTFPAATTAFGISQPLDGAADELDGPMHPDSPATSLSPR